MGHDLRRPLAGESIALEYSGSVFANPRFVNSASGDYHLSTGSPAIDTGSFVNVRSDLDHQNRPICGVDIGAYEFPDALICKTLLLPLIQR